MPEHRACIDECVEFPVLATGVDLWRQIRKQLFIGYDRLIAEAATLQISDRFRLQEGADILWYGPDLVVVPALAIPVDKKDEFACPHQHIQELATLLPRVTKLMTIGWRGTEDKFLEMLRSGPTGLPHNIDLMIVSGSNSGADETFQNLRITVSLDRLGSLSGGFTGLINSLEKLQAFLRESPWQTGR